MSISYSDLTSEAMQLTSAVGELVGNCHPGGSRLCDSRSHAAVFDALRSLELMVEYIESEHKYSMEEAFHVWISHQDVDFIDDLGAMPRIRQILAGLESFLNWRDAKRGLGSTAQSEEYPEQGGSE